MTYPYIVYCTQCMPCAVLSNALTTESFTCQCPVGELRKSAFYKNVVVEVYPQNPDQFADIRLLFPDFASLFSIII